MVLHIVDVQSAQEFVEGHFAFVELLEKFLGMAPGLGRSPRTDVLLHIAPVLAVEFESLQEPEVLLLGPAAVAKSTLLRSSPRIILRGRNIVLYSFFCGVIQILLTFLVIGKLIFIWNNHARFAGLLSPEASRLLSGITCHF